MTDNGNETRASGAGSLKGGSAVAVFSILAGLLGTGLGYGLQGYFNAKLERQKFEAGVIQKALETDDRQEIARRLKFYIETGVIQSLDANKIRNTVDKNISELPVFPAPTVENARIFLLAGTSEQAKKFTGLRAELLKAGFNVVGEKQIVDPGRPEKPEVRYYNASDRAQAEEIANAVRYYLGLPNLAANPFTDTKAKPGYLEIWLGK